MSLKTKLYRLFLYGIDKEEESTLDSSEDETQAKMDLPDTHHHLTLALPTFHDFFCCLIVHAEH